MRTGEDYPFKALYHLSCALYQQHPDTEKIIQTALTHAGEIVGVKQGCLLTFKEDNSIEQALVLNAGGSAGDGLELWETLLARGLVGFVYHAQRTVVIRNIQTDPRWPDLPDTPVMPREGSAIGLPLDRGTDVLGVMLFIHPQIDFFDEKTVSLLEEIAQLTASALDNALQHHTADPADVRYQTIFNDSVVPMLLTDLDGNIVDVNRKAGDLLYYDQDDLLNSPITTIHHNHTEALGIDDLHSLHVNEEIAFRTVARTALGDEIPVVVRVRRLRLNNRDVVEWVEQNVTAQMELEQLRRDLAAMVYHDLRGPLQSIKGSIYKLAEVLANHENPAVLTLLQIGIRSTRQLRTMIDSLLDVQRLEEGSAILNRNPVELRVLLADATQLVQPLAMEANQQLEFDFKGELPMIDVDNDMIIRVIINLMENAIKYTPDSGTITLGARAEDDKVYITVKDSGPGIAKERQAQIFDKFNRVKYRDAPTGLGLGLAFCRLAITAHGGKIWVESEPGEGSEFIFTLPITSASPDGPQHELATTV